MKRLVVLGASGSIGQQSLELLSTGSFPYELVAFSVGKRIECVPSILAKFPSVSSFCVQREEDASLLREAYPDKKVYSGDDGLLDLIKETDSDTVLNALVGFVGLVPTVISLKLGKTVLLANKESLVVGGAFISSLLKRGFGQIYPIDSEHVGLAKCLSLVKPDEVDELFITASGGSLRDLRRDELDKVSLSDVLNHPNWKMGAKITVDSATMMNKGFELIEAYWLFGYPLDKVTPLLHPQSHVHALVRLKDGTYLADVSSPSMKGPIAYALSEGRFVDDIVRVNDLGELKGMDFAKLDTKRYPIVPVCLKALEDKGTKTAILNGANDMAVELFLKGLIPFTAIETLVSMALNEVSSIISPSLDEVLKANDEARAYVTEAALKLTNR